MLCRAPESCGSYAASPIVWRSLRHRWRRPAHGRPFRRYSPRDAAGSPTSSRAIGYRPGAARAMAIGTTVSFGPRTGRQEPVSELPGRLLRVLGRAGHFLGMVVTLPLSRRGRLTVAWTRTGGFRAAAWRAEPRCGLFPEGDDGRGSVGVREPRRPRPPRLDGAVALPLDDEPPGATF